MCLLCRRLPCSVVAPLLPNRFPSLSSSPAPPSFPYSVIVPCTVIAPLLCHNFPASSSSLCSAIVPALPRSVCFDMLPPSSPRIGHLVFLRYFPFFQKIPSENRHRSFVSFAKGCVKNCNPHAGFVLVLACSLLGLLECILATLMPIIIRLIVSNNHSTLEKRWSFKKA